MAGFAGNMVFSSAATTAVIKKELDGERDENVAAEEDWRLVVKVEGDPPLDLAEVASVFVKQEDGDISPETMTGKEWRQFGLGFIFSTISQGMYCLMTYLARSVLISTRDRVVS